MEPFPLCIYPMISVALEDSSTDKVISTQMEDQNARGDKALFDVLADVSKSAAALIIVIYVSVFLVTSLYYASFGIPQLNPFRAQVLSAGVWAAILLGLPVILAHRTRSSRALDEFLRSTVWYYALVWLLVVIASRAMALESAHGIFFHIITPLAFITTFALLQFLQRSERYSKTGILAVTALFLGAIGYSVSSTFSLETIFLCLALWGQLVP
jgi:hypothetical protein